MRIKVVGFSSLLRVSLLGLISALLLSACKTTDVQGVKDPSITLPKGVTIEGDEQETLALLKAAGINPEELMNDSDGETTIKVRVRRKGEAGADITVEHETAKSDIYANDEGLVRALEEALRSSDGNIGGQFDLSSGSEAMLSLEAVPVEPIQQEVLDDGSEYEDDLKVNETSLERNRASQEGLVASPAPSKALIEKKKQTTQEKPTDDNNDGDEKSLLEPSSSDVMNESLDTPSVSTRRNRALGASRLDGMTFGRNQSL